MSVAQPAKLDTANSSDSERLGQSVVEPDRRPPGLNSRTWREICRKSPAGCPPRPTASGISRRPPDHGCANHDIATASRAVQTASSAAVGEDHAVARRGRDSVQHISELIEAVGRIEHALGAVGAALAAGGQGIRFDRGDRQADQPAGAECDHRGRPGRGGGTPALRSSLPR